MADFKKIIEESFTQYSGAVIQSRALVDVRDCLKPSARQIFYCMETDGFTSNKQYKKTLKAIGSAMRTYIHGDASCEGIIMRAGQPFAMRYPLIDVEGSYGNQIETANWAAPRYCITGDTLINTSRGIIPIKDIIPSEPNSDNIINTLKFKGINQITSSNLLFNSGMQDCYKLTLQNGIELKGTPNHPLLTLDNKLNFYWKTIDELQIGDKVLLNTNINNCLFGNYDNVEMGAALGCLVSEGCLTQANKIDIINSDLEMIKPVYNQCVKYGSTAKISKRAQKDKCYQYTTSNINFYNFLKNNNVCYNSYEKHIPKCVFEGTKEVQIAFLKYLFEGDGSIVIKHKGKSDFGNIIYSSVSKNLILELQVLLLTNFGIMSGISKQKNRPELKLTIGGEDLLIFANEIGFVSERKNTILNEAKQLYKDKTINHSSGSRGWHKLPEILEYIGENYKGKGIVYYSSKRKSYQSNKGILCSKYGLSNLKTFLKEQEYQKIENLLLNYCYIEIINKEYIGKEIVYSPKINEETNEFTSNGLISHNTASRLSAITSVLFEDLKKDTIDDWRDNYDDTEKYPAVLPSKGFYNIVNGTFGIAVGAASSIPQFNLREVNAALITLLNNPEAEFEDIYCPPDFATGCTLINEKAIKLSLQNGNGSACCLRAKIDYDKKKNTLTVVEIPYNVYTNTICKELEAIVNGEDNPGIDRINDLTGEHPCIKIYLDKGADPDRIKNFLYRNTSLQSSFGINLTMLDQGRYPKVFTWKEALMAHLAHEKEVYIKGYEYDLKKLNHRIKIVSGIIKAIEQIEKVIELIKSSSSTVDANIKLQEFLMIDEEQAKAILDIKLARLARLEIQKFQEELVELQKKIEEITAILNSEDLLKQEIIKGLESVAKKYGDDRRTIITNIEVSKDDKEIASVEPEKCVVVMTKSGLIKRVAASAFKTQKRAGKGVRTQDDITSAVIRTNTIDSLMIFTNKGKMYRLLVDNIPEGTNTTNGVSIKSLVVMENDEQPQIIYSIYRNTEAKYVLFITKNGMAKKTALEEYVKTKKKTGIAAINLKDGDEIASVSLVKDEPIVILTKKGMGIKFSSLDISATSRTTAGVKGITLNAEDEVVAALPIRNPEDKLALFVENGVGKKIDLNELVLQHRGGKGIICYKTSDITGLLSAAALVDDEDKLLICGNTNSICISATEVPLLSRASTGNQILKNNRIVSVSKV